MYAVLRCGLKSVHLHKHEHAMKCCCRCWCTGLLSMNYESWSCRLMINFAFELTTSRSCRATWISVHCFDILPPVPPFPQIDIIGAVVIVWRVGGKIVRSVLCNIVCNNSIVHSAMHTHMNRPNRSLDWVLSHWAHFTVLDSFLCMHVNVCIFCMTVYCMNV